MVTVRQASDSRRVAEVRGQDAQHQREGQRTVDEQRAVAVDGAGVQAVEVDGVGVEG
jgi:hypothetical protein